MKTRDRAIAMRQAERWAYEEHWKAVWALPAEIRTSIDWERVARKLDITWPESNEPPFEQDLQRVIDYLYDDEASDYEDLEKSFQSGHIFESIRAVQRWLNHYRSMKDRTSDYSA